MEVKRKNIPVLISMFVTLIQQINVSSTDGTICNNGGTQIGSNFCMCPGGLVGKNCNHSLYISFDTLDNLILMEGTEQRDFEVLVVGPVNSAVKIIKSKNQWIDLGFHPEVCLTQRYGCGVAGGAVSMWLKFTECGGILTTRSATSSYSITLTTGLNVACRPPAYEGSIPYILVLPNGYNIESVPIRFSRPQWFHIVFNIIGPKNGEGFRIYHDGKLVSNVTRFYKRRFNAVDGKIVIGRFFTNRNSSYASFEMDELLFFNRSLTEAEIKMLSN